MVVLENQFREKGVIGMKKVLAMGVAACMAVSMLAGCGAASSTANSGVASGTASAAAGGEGQLSVSWWGGDTRHEATQAALDAYTAAHPETTFKTHYGAWTGWEDAMSTSFFAGTAEDICQVNWNWIFAYDNDGSTFLDLNTVSDSLDLTQFDSKVLESCTVDGKVLCVPTAVSGRLFFWNEKSFENAGIEVPKTYDDLIAAGTAFKENIGDDAYPLAMNELDRALFLVYVLQSKYGKPWIEDGVLNYTQEEVEYGLQLIKDLEEAHVIPTLATLAGDGAESLDKNPKMMDGRYGGIFEWDSAAEKVSSALDEGMTLSVGGYLTGFGDYNGAYTKISLGFAITQTCKNPEEAAKVINFLLNEEEGAALMGGERGVPLSKAGREAAEAAGTLNEIVAEANAVVVENAEFTLDYHFEDASLKNTDGIYYDVMGGLSYGDYDVATAAEILIDGTNEVLGA